MSEVSVPVSPGELVDKITILEIKCERIEDQQKRNNVRTEFDMLTQTWEASSYDTQSVSSQRAALKAINEKLWEIEDAIRVKESEQAFDQEFIDLARAVYFTNDKRAEIKKEINIQLGSALVEEKSYEDYQ